MSASLAKRHRVHQVVHWRRFVWYPALARHRGGNMCDRGIIATRAIKAGKPAADRWYLKRKGIRP